MSSTRWTSPSLDDTRVLLLLLLLCCFSVHKCSAQEAPSIFVNNMMEDNGSLSPLARTNVCARQGLIYNQSMDLRNALSGCELSVAIRKYAPELQLFSLQDGRIPTENPGILVILMDELARRANFTWRTRFAAVEQLDNNMANVTWSDVLEWEVTNFDISVDDWYRTNDRRARGISFPRGFFTGGVVMGRDDLTLLQKRSIYFWSHLWPFESSVWYMIVFLTFVNGSVYYCLEYGLPGLLETLSGGSTSTTDNSDDGGAVSGGGSSSSSRSHDSSSSYHDNYSDDGADDDDEELHPLHEETSATFSHSSDYYYVEDDSSFVEEASMLANKSWIHKWIYSIFLSSILASGFYRFHPTSGPSRILCLSWGFSSLIMASGYTANLASAFVSRRNNDVTLVGIDDAIATSTPLCVHRGTPVDYTITEDYPQLILVRKDTVEEMFASLNQPYDNGAGTGCDAVLSSLGDLEQFQVQHQYNPSCTLTTNRQPILPFSAGVATAVDTSIYCTSLISYVIDLHIREMEADRFIQAVWTEHLRKISTNQCFFKSDGTRVSQTLDTTTAATTNDDSRYSLSFLDMGGIFVTHMVVSVLVFIATILQYYIRQGDSLISPSTTITHTNNHAADTH